MPRKGLFRACVSICALLLTAGQLALTPVGASAATFTTFAPPLTGASDFASGFVVTSPPGDQGYCPGNEGPIGVLNDGAHVFVTDICNATLYQFPAAAPPNPVGGYSAATATQLKNGLNAGLGTQAGNYYGVSAFRGADDGVYRFDPVTLARGTRIATTSCPALGVVGDPQTAALYVSTLCGIFVIPNPTAATPTLTPFGSTAGREWDGIYFTADGSRLWSAYLGDAPAGGGLRGAQEFDRLGNSVLDRPSNHAADGIAVANPTAPNGVANNAFVNNNDGTIERIDTNTTGSPSSVVAAGGTRGDHVATGPDGCMYAAQSAAIEKLAPCFFQAPRPPTMTGHAFGAAAFVVTPLGNVTVPPTPNTGPVSTTVASTTTTPCVASISGLLTAHVLCANVTTTLGPPKSVAAASVADLGLSLGVTIAATGLVSNSTTTCAGASGTASIASLKINGTPIAVAPGPNTVIALPGGLGEIIFNEQTPVPGADHGLTVNALHIILTIPGPIGANIIIASSTSDIHNCVAT